MSSGGRGSRGNKGSRISGGDRSGGGGGNSTTTQQQQQQQQTTPLQPQKMDGQTTDKSKGGDAVPHKIAPTAEQLRIAQMIDNTRTEPEKLLQEKIHQVMQFTSVTSDDAMVALHDCDNDVNAAIDLLLEGDDQGKWQESTKKKKKPVTGKVRKGERETRTLIAMAPPLKATMDVTNGGRGNTDTYSHGNSIKATVDVTNVHTLTIIIITIIIKGVSQVIVLAK